MCKKREKERALGRKFIPEAEMVKVGRTGKKSAEEGGVWASD